MKLLKAAIIGVVLGLLTMGASCPGQYSTDASIMAKQKFNERCSAMDQGIKTAIQLGKAGLLKETEAQVMDRVVKIYGFVCGEEADPENLSGDLKDAAARIAVAEICPQLVPSEDALVTVAQAAACAARAYILLKLVPPKEDS